MSALHTRTPGISLGAMPDSSLPFARSVLGQWLMDEGAGNSVLDSGLYGNHGEMSGNAKRASTARGPALQFDGINAYVSVPDTRVLMPLTRMTVMVRTRNLVSPGSFDCILIKPNDANWHQGYGIWYDSATLLKFYVTRYDVAFASIAVNPLAENMIVGTYDGSVVRVFVNGVAGTPMNDTGGIVLSTGPLEIGRGRDNAHTINGLVYQSTILDLALDPQDALRASAR